MKSTHAIPLPPEPLFIARQPFDIYYPGAIERNQHVRREIHPELDEADSPIRPLAVFFLTYWKWDLLTATAWLMGATVIALGIYYKFTGRVPMMPLMTVVIVAIFGGLTLWLQDETFIKMKPTIVEGLFSAILLGGLAFKRRLLKPLMGHAWPMKDRGWHLLSLRFGIFFAAMAVLNEIVWRNYPTDVWVTFKVFGLMGLTLAFAIAQAPLMKRFALPHEKKPAKKADPPGESTELIS